VLRGLVDLYAPNSTQSIPGGFIIVVAGDKVRLEIDARPAVSFRRFMMGNDLQFTPGSNCRRRVNSVTLLTKFDQPATW